MKIGITGHTHGIGKAAFELFSKNGHTVKGFSRQNGYDIDKVPNRQQILHEVKDFDVFINNAFSPNQTTMLQEMIELWDGQDKSIINIGSKVTMMPFVIPGQEMYVAEKKKQEQIVKDRLPHPLPQITNLVVGLTDTRMVANWEGCKLDPNYLAKVMEFIIENRDFVELQTIVIDVPKQRLTEIKIHQ